MKGISLNHDRCRRQSIHRSGARALIIASVVLGLYGCSSDDSDPATTGLQTDTEMQPVTDDVEIPADNEGSTLSEATATPTSDVNALAENALYLNDQSRCSIVGEDVSFSVQARSADSPRMPDTDPAVNGFVTLVQTLSDSAELVSRTDDQIVLQITRPDITGITAETAASSVTGYFSAIEADAPDTVIQRKVIPGGCLYSLRMPGFCGTALSRNGEVTLGSAGAFIGLNGCELQNPLEIPVRELPAFGQ